MSDKALLNKTVLFLLDRKFVSTSRNKEFVKRRFHLRQKLFSLPGISDEWEKRLLQEAMKFFCRNWLPHNFNNGITTSKKNTLNTKKYYFT